MQEKRHRPEPVRRTGLSDRHRKWGKETTVKRGLSLLVGLAVAAAPGLASAETTLRLAHMNSPTHFVNRSEEHTSELQSLMRISYAVFCLKKKHIKYT